ALAVSLAGAPSSQPTTSSQPRELLPEEQIQQALSRLTFGARPGDMAAVRATGVDQWIEQQLRPERIQDSVAQRLASGFSIYKRPTSEIVRDYNTLQQLQRQVNRTA